MEEEEEEREEEEEEGVLGSSPRVRSTSGACLKERQSEASRQTAFSGGSSSPSSQTASDS